MHKLFSAENHRLPKFTNQFTPLMSLRVTKECFHDGFSTGNTVLRTILCVFSRRNTAPKDFHNHFLTQCSADLQGRTQKDTRDTKSEISTDLSNEI